MTKEQRQALEAPFAPHQIKQRTGSYGQTLDYVEGHTVIARLNEAFQGDWSFETVEHWLQEESDEVIVLGRLTAAGVVKTHYGSAGVKRRQGSNEAISIGNDIKAGATDCLKKAATLFGVGLHLYGDGQDGQGQQEKLTVGFRGPEEAGHGRAVRQGAARQESPASSRLSQKQHSYILKLATEAGLTKEEINDHCRKSYGKVVDFLTRNDASAFIDDLINDRVGRAA